MGQLVEFPSNGHTCRGYLAAPAAGRGPAVVVIQEWWGLVPHIEDLVERFAKEGFLAIAPDLYHGKKTTSPDEAGRMLMELDGDRAERDIAGAGSYLLSRPDCASKKYGVVGFCMGGALAQYTAAKESSVGAGVSFYGGFKQIPIPWPNLAAPLLLIYGENDGSVTPDSGRKLAGELTALGKKVELTIYPNAGHAFFNDSRPQVYNKTASEDAWKKMLNLFRANL
ncbi:MAG TPA: dienelactone hydrolase family protein [Thermoanaerobaculia bacterium]|nr:dienelactone hydrolase family protein [Thermoanaerobaculia bacterium]